MAMPKPMSGAKWGKLCHVPLPPAHLEVSFNFPQDQVTTIRLYCRPDRNVCMRNMEANGKHYLENKRIPPAMFLVDSQDPVHTLLHPSRLLKFQHSSHNHTVTTQASWSYSTNAMTFHSPKGNALMPPGGKTWLGPTPQYLV